MKNILLLFFALVLYSCSNDGMLIDCNVVLRYW